MLAGSPQNREDNPPLAATSSRVKWILAVCILLGLVLRGIEAHEKSLWLDELHSLHIADSDSFDEIVDK
jgi:hypothetical protein